VGMLVSLRQQAYPLMAPFLKMDVRRETRRGGSTRRFIVQREINPRELRGHLRGSCAPTAKSLKRETGDAGRGGAQRFMATIKNDILPGSSTTTVYRGLTHPPS